MRERLPLYDRNGARARDAAALTGHAPGTLMERAGQAAWRLLLGEWPQAQRLLVLCGPGNNGGDGLVLARLAHVSGRQVQVAILGEARTADSQHMRDAARAAGVVLATGLAADAFAHCDVIVDALFGLGLEEAPHGLAAGWIRAVNASGVPVLAIDVPSGVDADTGAVPGAAVRASHTLQCLSRHRGLVTGAACDYTGQLHFDALGISEIEQGKALPAAFGVAHNCLVALRTPRARNSNKGQFGHVACAGGDHGMGGAIVLAAEAAMRAGAGRVSVLTRTEHVTPVLSRRPEVMAHGNDDAPNLPPWLDTADACVLGPGLGQADWGRRLFEATVAGAQALVVDADALNLLAAMRTHTFECPTVLTPHPGEAARLLGTSIEAIQAERYRAAGEIARRFGCAVVLKGCGSIVAAPGCTPRVVCAGNPGMASAGMGDVLAGVIGTLLAQGHDAFEAASLGAAWHACAGDEAVRVHGERGLLASDLIATLPAVLQGVQHP